MNIEQFQIIRVERPRATVDIAVGDVTFRLERHDDRKWKILNVTIARSRHENENDDLVHHPVFGCGEWRGMWCNWIPMLTAAEKAYEEVAEGSSFCGLKYIDASPGAR